MKIKESMINKRKDFIKPKSQKYLTLQFICIVAPFLLLYIISSLFINGLNYRDINNYNISPIGALKFDFQPENSSDKLYQLAVINNLKNRIEKEVIYVNESNDSSLAKQKSMLMSNYNYLYSVISDIESKSNVGMYLSNEEIKKLSSVLPSMKDGITLKEFYASKNSIIIKSIIYVILLIIIIPLYYRSYIAKKKIFYMVNKKEWWHKK